MTPPIRLIGIAGPDQCGKTTLATALGDLLPGQTLHLNFADALREELTQAMRANHSARHLDRYSPDDLYRTPRPEPIRQLLRAWGAWRRAGDPDYWVCAWSQRLERAIAGAGSDEPLTVLCSDVRYINEVDRLHAHGGRVIYLDDVSQPLEHLGQGAHQLADVRLMADVGYLVNPARQIWADPHTIRSSIDD